MRKGDIVDVYGRVISREESFDIVKTAHGLPAASRRDDILHAIGNHPITIVQGETGSGKTTQIPKFLARKYPKSQIVVTQPRVISAMANANRVALELLAETGNVDYSIGRKIGYRTGPQKSHPTTAPLSFHTDGLELRRQMVASIVPHILVLDEAHGFSVASEMISWNMRERLRRDPKLRMIITSATLDPAIFREYYKNIDSEIPLIQIPGRTFPVDRMLDSDDSPLDIIVSAFQNGENILVFESGKKEIELQIEKLRNILGSDAQIFPLHAEMPKEEQERLLKKEPNDVRPRIIVATNVAEESITIDYIDRVVDYARYKVARYNEQGIQGLYLEDIPQSSVKQRSGRAGRTHPGIYTRHSDTPYNELPEYGDAPIEKEMLDQHILMLLAEGYDIRKIIEDAKRNGEKPFYHRFDIGLLKISFERLKLIGAITKTGDLTELGYTLLRYPLDVYYGRMLHESIDRGCVDEMMVITAILEKKGFLSKEDTWKNLGLIKTGSSDLSGYVHLYRFFTASEITMKQAQKLKDLGVNPEEVDDFISRKAGKNTPKLFEIVDLSPIGVKKARIRAIYDKYLELQKRFEALNIPITHGKDKHAIATSIAAGSLFHHYIYQADESGFVAQKDQGKDAEVFRMGDISVIEPQDGAHYLGQPFIIGPKDEASSGLRLLSFLLQVDDAVLKDARLKNSIHANKLYEFEERSVLVAAPGSRDERVKVIEAGDTTDRGVGKEMAHELTKPRTVIAGESARRLSHYPEEVMGEESYANSLEQISEADFTSDIAARDYYLRYCLPLFLIENNLAIRKYVRGKSKEWVAIFRELLARFVLDEAHRIRLNNLEVTERSFRYDSGIFQRFEESDDFHIRYFRIHGVLPEIQGPNRDGYEEIFDFSNMEEVKDMEVMRKQYAKRLGQASEYRAPVDIDYIEQQYFTSKIYAISEGNGNEDELLAYSVIQDAYNSLGRLTQAEREPISRGLKKLNSRKKEIEKLSKKIRALEEVYGALYVVSDLRYKASSIAIHEHTLRSAGKIFEGVGIGKAQYEPTLARAFSNDARKRKRGAKSLKDIKDRVEQMLGSYSDQRAEWESQITFAEFPQIRILGDALDTLVKSMYLPEYLKLRIQPKILDALRALVRDQGTEKAGVDDILFELLYQGQSGKFLLAHGKYFEEIYAYIDAWEVIENHQEDIAEEVKKSEDIEYIRSMLEGLEASIAQLQGAHQALKQNPLYKNFSGAS